MNAADLRNIAMEARPVIDRMLDDAEILSGLREAATEKGIDWSQLKALVTAQAKDARDDGNRAAKLVEKAEFASAYAALLATNMNENRETRSYSPTVAEQTVSAPQTAAIAYREPYTAPDEQFEGIPDFLRRTADNRVSS